MNPDHTKLFENAKKAQNNIVEESRLRYRQSQEPQSQDEWYEEAVPPDNCPEPLDILSTPDLDAEMDIYEKIVGGRNYILNPDLSKNQRRQVKRTLGKLETLLDTGWVTFG